MTDGTATNEVRLNVTDEQDNTLPTYTAAMNAPTTGDRWKTIQFTIDIKEIIIETNF